MGQFLLSAAVGMLISRVAMVVYGRWVKPTLGVAAFAWGEAILLAVVVGLSILLWRAPGKHPVAE